MKPSGKREQNRMMRRAAIVALARGMFLEHGYAGTSMSSIAQSLGGSKGTLWAHFPSKEALFEAVMDEATTAFRADLDAILDGGTEPRATLAAFGHKLMAKLVSPGSVSLQRLIVAEAERFPALGSIFYDRGPRRMLESIGRYLDGEMREGRLRSANPQQAAIQFVNLLQMPQQLKVWNAPVQIDGDALIAHGAAAIEVFLRAYAPEERTSAPASE
jgi:TetR/AcrR family transcriptional repressor of mexJK operon